MLYDTPENIKSYKFIKLYNFIESIKSSTLHNYMPIKYNNVEEHNKFVQERNEKNENYQMEKISLEDYNLYKTAIQKYGYIMLGIMTMWHRPHNIINFYKDNKYKFDFLELKNGMPRKGTCGLYWCDPIQNHLH